MRTPDSKNYSHPYIEAKEARAKRHELEYGPSDEPHRLAPHPGEVVRNFPQNGFALDLEYPTNYSPDSLPAVAVSEAEAGTLHGAA